MQKPKSTELIDMIVAGNGEVGFGKVLEAQTPMEMLEASLTRLWQHYRDRNEKSFAILSAYRHDEKGNAESGSQANMKRLKNMLIGRRIPFVNLRGVWFHELENVKAMTIDQAVDAIRDTGRDVDVSKTIKEKDRVRFLDAGGDAVGMWTPDNGAVSVLVNEPSVWAMGIDRSFTELLMKKFNQDGVIYSGPDTKGRVVLIQRRGPEFSVGAFHPKRIGDLFSRIKGKDFTFIESLSTWGMAMIKDRLDFRSPLLKSMLR